MPLDTEENRKAVIAHFPGLESDIHFKITSPLDQRYNCLAWANMVSDIWYWPYPRLDGVCTWPNENISLHYSNLASIFEAKGFKPCESPNFENNVIKIAIYVDENDNFTHAARQTPTGVWQSKLGPAFDIIHGNPHTIENNEYGEAKYFLSSKHK